MMWCINLLWYQRKRIYKSGITRWHLKRRSGANEKHVFSLFFYRLSLIYTAIALCLPYFPLYFTLNVTILSEVQSAEVIDRGEKSEFFKSKFFISKNDVSSVQENSKNTANALREREIDFLIFCPLYFRDSVWTYLQRETKESRVLIGNRSYMHRSRRVQYSFVFI